jgi:hypothetical protein
MRQTLWETIAPNLTLLVISLVAFAAVIYALFLIGSRASIRWQGWLRYGIFLGPALLLLLVGLIYPALRTIWMSFMDKRSESFIGFDNYLWAFTIPEIQIVLRNTMLWVIFVPLLSTAIGLAIAYMTDRMKNAGVVKSLIFMPMAVSFVGASVIWSFVYNFEPRARAGNSKLFAEPTVEHLFPDHRFSLDSDGVCDGDSVRCHEKRPRRRFRSGNARWREQLAALYQRDVADDSRIGGCRSHDHHYRDTQSVRHCANNDRRKFPNQRDC